MKTIKYSVAYYTGIGQNPMVILLDRPIGNFNHQFENIEELREFIREPIIYFVADKDDNRIDELSNWHGGKFNFEKLKELSKS